MDITIKNIINILNNGKNDKISKLYDIIENIDSISEFSTNFQEYFRNNINNFTDNNLHILLQILINKNLEYFKKNIIINKLKKSDEKNIPNSIDFIKKFYTLNADIAKSELWINYFFKLIKMEFKEDDKIKNITNFKKLNIFINILLQRLNAIFDRSFGNQDFILKMFSLSRTKNLEKNEWIHVEEMINRIIFSFKLFGKDFFEKYNIKAIKVSEFIDNYTFVEKCKYMKYVNDSIIKILLKTKFEIKQYDKKLSKIEKILHVEETDYQKIITINPDNELLYINPDCENIKLVDKCNNNVIEEAIGFIDSDEDIIDIDEDIIDDDEDIDVNDDVIDSDDDIVDSNDEEDVLNFDTNDEEDVIDKSDNEKKNINSIEIKNNSIIILNDVQINNIVNKWSHPNNVTYLF